MSNHEKLSRLIFIENLKILIIPALVLVAIVSIFGVFFFNVPVRSEIVHGTIIRTWIAQTKTWGDQPIAFVELDNGRTVNVALPSGQLPPHDGESISMTRYFKRFFGDGFVMSK
jgi:hypothetical protein